MIKTDEQHIVLDFPKKDVAQVVHANWEESDHYSWICSNCGEDWLLIEGSPKQNNMNFCPRCGAKMDLEE